MGILQLISKFLPFSLGDPTTQYTSLNIGDTFVGKVIDERSSIGITSVWSAVRLIAETGGSLPLHFYERSKDNSATRIFHPLDNLLANEPNAYMTSAEFWECMFASLALWGNAYALKETNTLGQVISLMPIAPNRMTVARFPDRIEYRVAGTTQTAVFTPEQIFHLKLFSFDGLVGISPIAACRQALGLSVAAEEFGARYFGSGARPSGFLTTDQVLTPEQRNALKETFSSANAGLSNAHKIAVLEAGFKFDALTIPNSDGQFIESRKFSVEEVARIFRVPPHLIMDLSHATFSNVENLSLQFVTYSLRPYLVKAEAAIRRSLLSPAEKARIFAEFSVEGLLRGDQASRSEFYNKLFQIGALSPNEIRRLERLPTYEGGDEHFVQVNMATVKQIASQRTQVINN
jgi:HK97 family phage portal protein